MTTTYRSRIVLMSLLLLGSALPAITFAAEPPECLLGVVTKTDGKVFTEGSVGVQKGEWAYVLWVSSTGSVAENSNGVSILSSGFQMVVANTTATYEYRFMKNGEEVECSATLEVTQPPAIVEGPTTLRVATVPLLSGGVASPGASVPVAYLQVLNAGKAATSLRGFRMEQKGNASMSSVIGLSVIDDKGSSVSLSGGAVGGTPFVNGMATAKTDIVLPPGQRKLFTIRAVMAPVLSAFRGSNLTLDVTGVDTDASVQGIFPIRGTTWVIQ